MSATEDRRDRRIEWAYLGRVSYRRALAMQDELRAALLAGTGRPGMLLLEHPPTVVLGRRGGRDDILVTQAELDHLGIAVEYSDRGGLATYHGPGQLVGYPIVDLKALAIGPQEYVLRLAEALRGFLAGHRIATRWSSEHPGLWLDDGAPQRKIASFGVHIHRGVTTHGFALNVQTELAAFEMIVPCGMPGTQTVSMASVLGELWTVPSLAADVARAVASALGLPPREVSPEHLGR